MKFYKGDMNIRVRDTRYSLDSENAYKLKSVQGHLCEQEPSLGLYKDGMWRVTLLDVGQGIPDNLKILIGTRITIRKTLKEAKKVVEIFHQNIDEFNVLLADGLTTSLPDWLKDIRKGEWE